MIAVRLLDEGGGVWDAKVFEEDDDEGKERGSWGGGGAGEGEGFASVVVL